MRATAKIDTARPTAAARAWAPAALACMGVVFGDIGTSPLYTLNVAAKASSQGAGTIAPEAVLGIVSLIFWSLIIVISIKYAALIMRADNRGEGGILALLALISPKRAKQSRRRAIMVVIGLVGATLLYGDGAITPAISVLSAIEGIKVYAPQLEHAVVPLIQLGFLPRMNIIHTTRYEIGQIYVPFVNWTLAMATLAAVIGFGSSDALAGAFGIAVSLLMAITTLMATFVALHWKYNPLIVYAVNGSLIALDLLFFASTSTKLLDGGWFPLLIALIIAFLMLTWRKGEEIMDRIRLEVRQRSTELIERIKTDPPFRIPGTAVVLGRMTSGVPLALTQNLRHNHVLHEKLLLVAVTMTETPRVSAEDRAVVTPLSDEITRVQLNFGFMEHPDVPKALELAVGRSQIAPCDPERVTYFTGHETIIPTGRRRGMARGARRCSRSCIITRNVPAPISRSRLHK
jgi:K+ transporter